ncbi:MAG: CcdB family protein [Neoaquamicrobium sediminum]|uniref:CcdB family protein n=1 Tax=Neoaquamicrobium sediminum TaxID=1849104 RepID=UPI001D45FF25|nr:CcdB family protein [Mesorhizobium sp.]
MARFQVFAQPGKAGYLLDVQSELIDIARTRVVVPLMPAKRTPPAIARLHPVFEIGGDDVVMATHLIATVPTSILTELRGDLSAEGDKITAALDMLFQGF